MNSPTLEEVLAKLTVFERAVDDLQARLREQIFLLRESMEKPEKPLSLPEGKDPAGGKIVRTRSSDW